MKNQSIWRRTYDFLVEHRLLSTFIATIPGWFFSLVELLGKTLGWVDNTGEYTPWVSWILGFLFIFSIIYNFLYSYSTQYDKLAKQSTQSFLAIMIDCVNEIKLAKVSRFAKYIDRHKGRSGQSPFAEITQPREQIDSILRNFQTALSSITGIRRGNIGLSIIAKTKDDEWQWLAHLGNEDDLPLSEIINNPNSTIHPVITGATDLVFIPNKSKGQKEGKYVTSKRDVSPSGNGSILCKNLSIGTNQNYISAILSISTYGFQLCLEDDLDAQANIIGTILPTFERRLQLELSLLYIKEVMAVTAGKQKTQKKSTSSA